jgi:1,4-dihydroxy-2-naphthoate polyprenyltransferase
VSEAAPSGNRWVLGARPRTLPAAVVPVVVGTACTVGEGGPVWWRAALALVVSLALQVGTNYANDYSDGIRGTDDVRVGPVRLVASGLAAPGAVKRAAVLSFLVAAVAGLVLAAVAGWWILAVGAAALAAGWFYTGGPRPYGYAGFGEVFVFVFFGVVATVGTTFVQVERFTAVAWWASVPVGCFATALLVVNNLRDIPTDREAGKRTLAVRLGDRATRGVYLVLMLLPFLVLPVFGFLGRPLAAIAYATVLFARLPVQRVLEGARGPALIPVLVDTGRVQLAFGALMAAGLAIGGL